MRSRRLLAPVALIFSIALAVVGCAAAPQPTPTPSDPSAMTCDQYSKLSKTDRQDAAEKLQFGPFVSFDADGVSPLDATDYLDATCAAAPTLANLAELTSRAGQQYPPCTDFLALKPTVQELWAAEVMKEFEIAIPTADYAPALTVACASTDATDKPDVGSAASDVILFMHNHPLPADFAAYLAGNGAGVPTAGAGLASAKLVDANGYEIDYTVASWGALMAGAPPCTLDSSLAPYLSPAKNVLHFMRVTGTISRPTVNGFTFEGPVGIVAGVADGYNGFNQTDYIAGVCGDGLVTAGVALNGSYTFSFPQTPTAQFDVSFWYTSAKTPNSPDGVDISGLAPQAYLLVFAGPGSVTCTAADASLRTDGDSHTCLIYHN
ncbi:MAG: hypothetical protein JWP19_356 [Rhodoglobus sp.]|nr:hypothetical protein [Rhodoglobus sp.]